MIEVNLTGTFITLKTVLPPMAAGRGNIIVTSLLGQRDMDRPMTDLTVLQFGIEGLVEVAVDEYSDNMLGNTVFPAMVDTGFATWSAADRAKLAS